MTDQDEIKKIELTVFKGMNWVGWEKKIIRALEELPGIKKTSAHFSEKRVNVKYDQSSVTIEQIYQTLFKAGFHAILKNNGIASYAKIGKTVKKSAFQKKELVCYCFGYTGEDIEQDFIKNHKSLIMGKIAAEKKAGGCDCVNKNPKGSWCLKDVRQVVDQLKANSER